VRKHLKKPHIKLSPIQKGFVESSCWILLGAISSAFVQSPAPLIVGSLIGWLRLCYWLWVDLQHWEGKK